MRERASVNESKSDRLADEPASFDVETAKFRAVLAIGRSAVQLRLFDYLVERSSDQRAPKEIEIALAVFGDGSVHDLATDSGVRVYVHRLRKRLDEFYADRTAPRLAIPKGEYRIVLAIPDRVSQRKSPPFGFTGAALARPVYRMLAAVIGCGLIALTAWLLWPAGRTRLPHAQLHQPPLWEALNASSSPVIVVGDSFLLAETKDQHNVRRMVMEPDIRSREELGSYLKTHPESFYRLYDFDLHFAPAGIALAAWDMQNQLLSSRSGNRTASLVPVSALNPEMLRSRHVVYVGRLYSLGSLAAPLFAVSRFQLAAYNQLVDVPSGKRFFADVYQEDDRKVRIDYGYIAMIRAPSGKTLRVIAGLGDMATQEMVKLVSSPQRLQALEAKVGRHRQFEALFELRSSDGVGVDRRPVLLRSLP